jgi:hypothetical protein
MDLPRLKQMWLNVAAGACDDMVGVRHEHSFILRRRCAQAASRQGQSGAVRACRAAGHDRAHDQRQILNMVRLIDDMLKASRGLTRRC